MKNRENASTSTIFTKVKQNRVQQNGVKQQCDKMMPVQQQIDCLLIFPACSSANVR